MKRTYKKPSVPEYEIKTARSYTRKESPNSWDEKSPTYIYENSEDEDYGIRGTRVQNLHGNLLPVDARNLTEITPDRLRHGTKYYLYNKDTHEKTTGIYIGFEPYGKKSHKNVHFNFIFEIPVVHMRKGKEHFKGSTHIVISGDTDQYRNPTNPTPKAFFDPNFSVFEPKTLDIVMSKKRIPAELQGVISEYVGGRNKSSRRTRRRGINIV